MALADLASLRPRRPALVAGVAARPASPGPRPRAPSPPCAASSVSSTAATACTTRRCKRCARRACRTACRGRCRQTRATCCSAPAPKRGSRGWATATPPSWRCSMAAGCASARRWRWTAATSGSILGRLGLRGQGKGGKERLVPILPIVAEALAAYLAACPIPPCRTSRCSRARGRAAAAGRRAEAGPAAPGDARLARNRDAARAAAQLRHASPRRRRRPAGDPGAVGPRQPVDHPKLHGGRRQAAHDALRPRPSARVTAPGHRRRSRGILATVAIPRSFGRAYGPQERPRSGRPPSIKDSAEACAAFSSSAVFFSLAPSRSSSRGRAWSTSPRSAPSCNACCAAAGGHEDLEFQGAVRLELLPLPRVTIERFVLGDRPRPTPSSGSRPIGLTSTSRPWRCWPVAWSRGACMVRPRLRLAEPPPAPGATVVRALAEGGLAGLDRLSIVDGTLELAAAPAVPWPRTMAAIDLEATRRTGATVSCLRAAPASQASRCG